MIQPVSTIEVRYRINGAIGISISAARAAKSNIPQASKLFQMLSYFAPNNCLESALIIFFKSQHLPDVSGGDFFAGEYPTDLALFQNKHPVRCQTDTF